MPRGRPRHDDILTPREWQVLRLVREGLTNEQIAGRLGISLSTAKYHVAEILAKLDVPGRQAAVERVDEQRRGAWGLTALPLPAPVRALAAGAVAAVLVTAAVVILMGGREGGVGGPAAVSEAQTGADLAPDGLSEFERALRDSPYQHSVLLAESLPANFGADDAAVVQTLARVGSLRHLEAVLSDEIRLIVVDSSSAHELEDSDFLQRQLEAGRAIVELNVCFDQVHYRGPYQPQPFAGAVTEIAPDGTVTRITADGSQTPPSTCSLPLAGGAVPFFGYRRLPTARELAEFQRLGRGIANESILNLNQASGALRVVIKRLDAGSEGNVLPLTCDEGRRTGLEHFACPDLP
jgi:DNA-binding CsgD family transcriptional regulator